MHVCLAAMAKPCLAQPLNCLFSICFGCAGDQHGSRQCDQGVGSAQPPLHPDHHRSRLAFTGGCTPLRHDVRHSQVRQPCHPLCFFLCSSKFAMHIELVVPCPLCLSEHTCVSVIWSVQKADVIWVVSLCISVHATKGVAPVQHSIFSHAKPLWQMPRVSP